MKNVAFNLIIRFVEMYKKNDSKWIENDGTSATKKSETVHGIEFYK